MSFRWSAVSLPGLMVAGLLAGCSGDSGEYKPLDQSNVPVPTSDDHGHGEKGPHGGDIVELEGQPLHAEVCVDEEKNVIDVYVLGGDGKTEHPIDAKEVKLIFAHGETKEEFALAAPADASGPVAKFSTSSKEVVDELHEHEHATLSFTVDGKEVSGLVHHHHDHAHEGHAHDEAGHKDAAKPEAGKTEETKPAADAPAKAADSDKPAAEKAEGDKPTEDKPAADKPAEEKKTEDKPTEAASADNAGK